MREFGQHLSTIWLPFQKTQCFHGESSNGRFDDFGKNLTKSKPPFVQRSPIKAGFRQRLYSMVATPSGSAHFSENVSKPHVFHLVGLGDFPTEFQEDSAAMSHLKGSLNVE